MGWSEDSADFTNQNKNSVQSSEFKKLKLTVNERACVVSEYVSICYHGRISGFFSYWRLFLCIFFPDENTALW